MFWYTPKIQLVKNKNKNFRSIPAEIRRKNILLINFASFRVSDFHEGSKKIQDNSLFCFLYITKFSGFFSLALYSRLNKYLSLHSFGEYIRVSLKYLKKPVSILLMLSYIFTRQLESRNLLFSTKRQELPMSGF